MSTTYAESDQWKGGGDCRKCRRLKYCKTECKAHKRYRETVIGQMIRERTGIDAIEAHIAHMNQTLGGDPLDQY